MITGANFGLWVRFQSGPTNVNLGTTFPGSRYFHLRGIIRRKHFLFLQGRVGDLIIQSLGGCVYNATHMPNGAHGSGRPWTCSIQKHTQDLIMRPNLEIGVWIECLLKGWKPNPLTTGVPTPSMLWPRITIPVWWAMEGGQRVPVYSRPTPAHPSNVTPVLMSTSHSN